MSEGNLRSVMMPAAMIVGGLLHHTLGQWSVITPYLIFVMLFIPFCGLKLRDVHLKGLQINLLLFQAVSCVAVYAILRLFDVDVAQGAMICILAPTASAAVVIASMLGARTSTMLSYSLAVNFAVAFGAPLFFTIISPVSEVSFGSSLVAILWRVIPVLVGPFLAALVLQKFAPKVADKVTKLGLVSFYLWLVALAIVVARTVNFIAIQKGLTPSKGLALAGVALVICLVQFMVGRSIGSRHGETVAGGQALGQKNTIIAIWLAQSYLNPVSSIAPAAYVLWQNLFNSVQLYMHNRSERRRRI